jgi:hypothetical protein
MPNDYSRAELARRRKELNKRVAKLAEILEAQRKVESVVASAVGSPVVREELEEKFPAMKSRRR